MSMRNIRKVFGNTALPPPEGSSDEEYEPLYAKKSPSKYKYQGLVLSSHSESEEHESTDAVGIENTPPVEISKKKKKKKKKQRKSKSMPRCSSKETLEMDEIDRSIMEVNAMLGSPVAPAPSTSTDRADTDPAVEVLAVRHKHLNVANELKKLFGPEDVEPGNRRRGRQPNLNRLLKKAVIVPLAENAQNFKKIGLSMSIHRRENGYKYFTFDHNKDYQRTHRTYLQFARYRGNDIIMPMDEDQRNLHIEGMLEGADSMFGLEEYTAANTLVEQAIAYMQYVAHPLFNLTDSKTRLEYKFSENRPFHIALLKYLHLLTNRACHRTALELAKALLQLDPSDPLAVLFIIDTLALRAREHQWLIDAFDYWSKERDACFMFNLEYSYAMAHYHVAVKSKGDLRNADELLRTAIMRFPMVVLKILECAHVPLGNQLQSHPLFAQAVQSTGSRLKDLIFLYCKFTWPKWREPPVLEWLTSNVKVLVDAYDKDASLQASAKRLSKERADLFRGWPEEIVRHLTVIKPMSNLLVDGAVPRVDRGRACDPLPPANGVNRYDYKPYGTDSRATVATNTMLFELFSSLLPNYDIAVHGMHAAGEREQHLLAELQEDVNNAEIEPGAEAEVEYEAEAEAEAETEYESESEDDTVTEDEDTATETEPAPAAGSAEPGPLVRSVGTVTNVLRRFMDVYEIGRDPDDEPNEPGQS